MAGVGQALLSLGYTSWQKGELATARVRLEESLKVGTEAGDKIHHGLVARDVICSGYDQGNYTQGYSYAEAGLLLFREQAIQGASLSRSIRSHGGIWTKAMLPKPIP